MTRLESSYMQSAMGNNRLFTLGLVAFGVSFAISLVFSWWDFGRALFTGIMTVPATYAAVFYIDNRRRKYDLYVLASLRREVKEMEGLKSRLVSEINQLEIHRQLVYTESNNLQNQIAERRNKWDSLNRELSTFSVQRKHLQTEIINLRAEIKKLENSQVELNNSLSALSGEKRRLELNCNITKADITQLQMQITELLSEKQEAENNLTLLNRLKPPLEEKLHDLRVEIQQLEEQQNEQNKLIFDTLTQREEISAHIQRLQSEITDKQNSLQQLQGQTSLLQQERDLLQNQVWELLQQLQNLSQEAGHNENVESEETELFPFNDFIDSLASSDIPSEWQEFLSLLPTHEILVLKAIASQHNLSAIVKQIAEEQITMPNLLIDSINEKANDAIGDFIIEPGSEPPEICQEYLAQVKKLLENYTNINYQAS